MSDLVLKISKPGYEADSEFDDEILFDSEKSNHPVFSQNDYLVDNDSYTLNNALQFVPKVWVNMINGISESDIRLPVTNTSISGSPPGYDYKIDNNIVAFSRSPSTDKSMRVIIFAKSVSP